MTPPTDKKIWWRLEKDAMTLVKQNTQEIQLPSAYFLLLYEAEYVPSLYEEVKGPQLQCSFFGIRKTISR